MAISPFSEQTANPKSPKYGLRFSSNHYVYEHLIFFVLFTPAKIWQPIFTEHDMPCRKFNFFIFTHCNLKLVGEGMKLYTSLGDLLMAYRNKNNLSQSDLAGMLDVDTRTVQRWERNATLVKPEKEPELVEATLLPHQLIRNLNSTYPIPTYYDFDLRKYSLSALDVELPDKNLIKRHMDIKSEFIRKIESKEQLRYVIRYTNARYEEENRIPEKVLYEACRLLPELNLYLTNVLGFYSGHSLVLPLKESAYKKLRECELSNCKLSANDLIDHHQATEEAIFYFYTITADSNSHLIFLLGAILRFFREIENKNYILSSFTSRFDNEDFNSSIGLKKLWKAPGKGMEEYYHFWEGNINEYLSKL